MAEERSWESSSGTRANSMSVPLCSGFEAPPTPAWGKRSRGIAERPRRRSVANGVQTRSASRLFVPQLFGGVMVCSGVCDVTESLLSNGSGFDHVDKLRADRQGSVEVGDRFYIVAPQGPGDATCIVGLTLLWEGGHKLQSVLQRSDRIPGRGSRQRTTAIELSVLRLSCNRRVEIRQ